jgi:DNA polymerase-3 subunit epsilon
LEFAAIDVETANADLASICQIGIARFSNGGIIDEWKTYVDPECRFDGMNVSIHGIDEATVAGAPNFRIVAGAIRNALDGRIVVTHTAFDKVALYRAARKYEIAPVVCTWLDSACVARRAWKQFSRAGYGLQNVCDFLGYEFKPHDALEDAKASGNILLSAMTHTGLDVGGWLARVSQPIDLAMEQQIAREGNPDGELFSEVLVFTGALSISRREAADYAAVVGCEVDAGVTKRTTILVVGDQDIWRLAGHEKSSKHRKAEALIKKGQKIRILQESDFRELIHLAT